MKIIFSEKHKDKKASILKVLDTFPEGGITLKEGSRNTLKIYEVDGLKINIKSFKIPNAVNKIVYRFFRKSKAQRSFEYANKLLDKGVGTPAPIAFIEESTGATFKKSFYISEHLEPDLTFRKLIREPEYPDHENILRQFTAFTYKLHENGILFKDHSPGNTLIKANGKNYDFYLVDLNRMDFKSLSFKERIKNFSRLTPKKEMVSIMSDEYAKLANLNKQEVFNAMWEATSEFQEKFNRKKRLKKKFLFWRS